MLTRRPTPHGPGADRFNRLLQQRKPQKLEQDAHMLYEHALRCYCAKCGSLLNWECPLDISYTVTECCGLLYKLQPWTVKVHIEDVSARPILPKMEGSDYADPAYEFSSDLIVGPPPEIKSNSSRTFSRAQIALRAEPSPKRRKCGVCRNPGHTRRNCPNA